MQWLELAIEAHPENVEGVSELLGRYTSDGVVIEQPIELIDEGQEYRVLTEKPVSLRAYVPVDGSEEAVCQKVSEGLWHMTRLAKYDIGPLRTRIVNDEDWAHAWKEHFYVTHIGKRIVIRPSWREYTPKPQEVVLTLDPGMAFGTGLHPTTRMCLEQLEQRVQPGMQVLDVGTGSGILAIAAIKLGAARAYAIDTSSVAVESTRANAILNNVEERITVKLGELDETAAATMAGHYDLVLANIIAQVIGSIAPQLAQTLAPHGCLVTSGIIEARCRDAIGPLQAAGLELIEQVMIDDWMALAWRKRE